MKLAFALGLLLSVSACSNAAPEEAVDTTLPNDTDLAVVQPLSDQSNYTDIEANGFNEPTELSSEEPSHVADTESAPEGQVEQADEASAPALQEPNWTPEEAQAIAIVRKRNEQCRGGSGDETATQLACQLRDTAMDRLKARGICYGEKGQSGYQMDYHRCHYNSL